jgi:putative metallohydrolase (TIGR04338 family)
MRDTNRNKLYNAEQAVRKSLKSKRGILPTTQDEVFDSEASAQAWLDGTLRSAHETAAQRKQALTIFTKPKVKGRTFCTYYSEGHGRDASTPEIGLYPGWGFCGIVVAHEYAHHLVRLIGDHNSRARHLPDHGAEFARVFVDVIRGAYGDAVAEALEAQYAASKVIYSPAAQRAAAHKQILRLRSDVLLDNDAARMIPITEVLYARDADDYLGVTYGTTFSSLTISSTKGNTLRFGDTEVNWNQLRHVEAPMVRVR